MTTKPTAAAAIGSVAQADASLATILFVALIGATLLFAAGFANPAVMHDAAHDTRHSVGFPCH